MSSSINSNINTLNINIESSAIENKQDKQLSDNENLLLALYVHLQQPAATIQEKMKTVRSPTAHQIMNFTTQDAPVQRKLNPENIALNFPILGPPAYTTSVTSTLLSPTEIQRNAITEQLNRSNALS